MEPVYFISQGLKYWNLDSLLPSTHMSFACTQSKGVGRVIECAIWDFLRVGTNQKGCEVELQPSPLTLQLPHLPCLVSSPFSILLSLTSNLLQSSKPNPSYRHTLQFAFPIAQSSSSSSSSPTSTKFGYGEEESMKISVKTLKGNHFDLTVSPGDTVR